MSKEYDKYLVEHRKNVQKAWKWMSDNNILELNTQMYNKDDLALLNTIDELIDEHDKSKNNYDEYFPYDDYFYNQKNNRSSYVVDRFNKAFLTHMHKNKHHWQYWILLEDDGKNEIIFDIPLEYIVEMICDWWSFSWKSGNLYEIFNWYDNKKNSIRVSPVTKKIIENILNRIEIVLESQVN